MADATRTRLSAAFKPHWLIALLVIPLLALGGGWLATGMVGSGTFPIRWVRVNGPLRHVSPGQVRAVVSPLAEAGFFAVDLARTRRAVEALPWVDRASVRKRWPDVLEVTVDEHVARATWAAGGFINQHGERFSIPSGFAVHSLPVLGGPAARRDEVVTMFSALSEQLSRVGLDIKRLQMTPRGAWRLTLSNGTRLALGRDTPLHRLERFVRAWRSLMAQSGKRMLSADLRYPNGFAVHWADAPPQRPVQPRLAEN